MDIRIGLGYDVHALSENETLVLGGVSIPHAKGTVAHSDGDVLLHALCDALLGAAALGDIGTHFPDTDSKYRGIDSRALLRKTVVLLKTKGFEAGNVDSTIAMQVPKLKPYIHKMRENIASDMNLSVEDVSVKATTTEELGFEGREEGISAQCVVLIKKI